MVFFIGAFLSKITKIVVLYTWLPYAAYGMLWLSFDKGSVFGSLDKAKKYLPWLSDLLIISKLLVSKSQMWVNVWLDFRNLASEWPRRALANERVGPKGASANQRTPRRLTKHPSPVFR